MIGCAILLSALAGCSASKHLKGDETFYDGYQIKVETHGNVRNQQNVIKKLDEFVEVKRSTKIFGSRPFVWIYFTAGKKNKGIGKWIKKNLGKPPVLLKDATPGRTAKTMNAQLYNMGFFDAKVRLDIKTVRKTSKVYFTADLNPAFYLKEINYTALKDTGYSTTFKKLRAEALIKKEQRYSLARLQAEQVRIEEVMQNLGFYYFNKHYVLFQGDTTAGQRHVDIDLTFEPKMPEKATRIYTLGKVKVYPDYSFSDTTAIPRDTINVNGFTYIERHHDFRPDIITNAINLKPGQIYTRNNRELTMGHLTTLGTFKFVNIKFTDMAGDSSQLEASVFLTPRLKKTVRFEIQGTSKSNNFVGPGIGVTFTNRNFLRGAEMFQFKINTAYEVQISRQQAGALNSFELAVETSLAVPRIVTPLKIVRYSSQKYLPQTLFKLGYILQQRIGYFQLNSFTGSYGFTWRETTSKSHAFYPIEVTYVDVSNTSQIFRDRLALNPALSRAFENQFIPGARYSFTFNSQLNESRTNVFSENKRPKNSIYFNGNLEVAGNLLNLTQNTVSPGEKGNHSILGSTYSQYARADIDFRYYRQFTRHDKIATRLIMGVGVPYGNSNILPYVKQFSIGGANSIRAFPARSLGPGTYNVRSDTSVKTTTYFIDQRGDIKLEGNFEYRFDIVKVIKGALFVDAGNIWLLRDDKDNEGKVTRPGAKFDSKTFLDQLAVGTGFGLRVDLNFFVLRFDLGIPLRKPYLPENQRWVIDKVNFGSGSWRSENLLLNIAIGYPF